jgi:hypothetical protein
MNSTDTLNDIIEILQNLRTAIKTAALNGGTTEYTIKTGQSTIITRKNLDWLQKQYDYWLRKYNCATEREQYGNVTAIRDRLEEA